MPACAAAVYSRTRVKLSLFSDLHLEFAPFSSACEGADVIVLAGDIDRGTRGVRFALEAFGGRPVIYVPGNHEHYGQHIQSNLDAMRELARGSAVHVLDCDCVEIAGVRFLGTTLWTDFAIHGEGKVWEAMEQARTGMNDYWKIREDEDGRGLMPTTTRMLHWQSRRWLEDQLARPHAGKTVVVSHHAPSLQSCPPSGRRSELAPAYASDLSEMMRGDINLWMHGHTHHCADYSVEGTRVVSNQRGYPEEPTTGFDAELLVEI
jgi:predicted phosphodiesterase